jgi:hypothetical protein
MTEKYLLFSLEDERAKNLGEVISNSACKKIVNFLAERECSASEIALNLKMPSKRFFWSTKGKKIENYKVVNKVIVISPKKGNVYSKLKGIIPVVAVSAILTAIVGIYYKAQMGAQAFAERSADFVEGSLMAAAPSAADSASKIIQEPSVLSYSAPWLWFALGGLVVLLAFLIWNWKKL